MRRASDLHLLIASLGCSIDEQEGRGQADISPLLTNQIMNYYCAAALALILLLPLLLLLLPLLLLLLLATATAAAAAAAVTSNQVVTMQAEKPL